MDKAKKKQLKKIITWVSMALVVVLLAAMPLIARQEAEADGPVASVLSAEVTRGSITASLHGGGNIQAETVEDVKIPSGVKIEGFLVKNGQFVTAGQPLAQVDKVSVMTAITEVTETLEYLRDELEDARDEKIDSTIKATAGGRVKKIFARKGEAVQDVMLRDGALAILSLDGLMAVKLERELGISTGESVTVNLADGKEVTGRVESNLDNVVVITLEDEGYEVGQKVTVTDADGKRLGQGVLYIHNAWKVTAYTGTIENVNTQEEKTLSSGAALFTLKDRDFEGELRRRANQHREYEELLQELFRMYESGCLCAPCDGEVEGVDNDSVHLLNATPEGWVIAPLSNTVSEGETRGWTVMLLSNDEILDDSDKSNGDLGGESDGCTDNHRCDWDEEDPSKHGENCIRRCDQSADCKAKTHYETCLSKCSKKYTCDAERHLPECGTNCTKASTLGKCALSQYEDANHHPNCIHSCTYGTRETACKGTKHHALGCIESCKEADGKKKQCDATGDHKASCIKSCIEADATGNCPATPHHSANCIEKCSGKMDCGSNKHLSDCPHYNLTYTAQAGIVVRVVKGKIEYTYESTKSYPVKKDGDRYTIDARLNPKTMVKGPAFVESNGVPCKAGDIILVITGTNADKVAIVKNQVYVYSSAAPDAGEQPDRSEQSAAGGMPNMSITFNMDISGMTGGMTGFGGASSAAVEEEPLYDLEGDTLLTVTAHDNAKLVISIDEHDIAKVSTGMKAKIKLEALKSQEFTAEVTSIAVSGTNNGGSSKFDVTLTLPMVENMLSGMSASAVIALEEKQDILLIPTAALVQQGAKTVVYTALDKEGKPSNPVEVTTGLTDGENAQILSGLAEGQKIYYSYYDNVELDTSAQASKYSFG